MNQDRDETRADADTGDGDEAAADADMAALEAHVAGLRLRFGAVQIFATREAGDGTIAATCGAGNWYARLGQVQVWLEQQSCPETGTEAD